MDYKLEDIVDIPLLQELQEKLNVIYSFPSAIIDNEGKILTAVAWQDICTKFYRMNPESEKECIKSDQYIVEHLHEANPAVSYQCPHGLIDNATPIIIEGRHLGNFFTGQFFIDKPDIEFFKNQAKIYGFDEKSFLEAVEKVPVWTKEKLSQYLDFIKGFIEIIAGIGLKNLKEIEANKFIKKNEERLRSIILSTSDWIWETDENGKYSYSSDKVEKILGYHADEIIGKSPFDLMPEGYKERIQTDFENILKSKSSMVDFENWNLHKNGNSVCLLTNGFPVFDDTGKLIGYRGADKDITERKLAEEKILKSLREKETLIRELYHRTKNNMQVIRGMVVLQAEKFPENKELQQLVKNTENRIQVISLVHQMLYKSQDLSRISIKEYIEELSSLIMHSYMDSTDRIKLNLFIEDQFFLLDTAIPFGLIINELMTNSLKYAFPDKMEGLISISLSKEKDKFILHYRDNGVGVNDGFNFRIQNSLGLKLIYRIGELQMMGKVEMENNNGVSCLVEFSDNLYQSRI